MLDQGLKRVSRSNQQMDNEALGIESILTVCGRYIRRRSARLLYCGLRDTINRLSPAYSWGAWLTVMLPLYYFAFFWVQNQFETGVTRWFGNTIKTIVYIVGGGIGFWLVGIIGALLSIIVCMIRRRNLPKEYRQPLKHREPWRILTLLGVLLIFSATMLGIMAQQRWIPHWNNMPLEWTMSHLNQFLEWSGLEKIFHFLHQYIEDFLR